MFKLSLLVVSFEGSPVCIASFTFRVQPLRMSLVTLFAAGCCFGVRHGRSVRQKDQDKSLGAEGDVGLHLHGFHNEMKRPLDRGNKITNIFWFLPGADCLTTNACGVSTLSSALLCGALWP